PDWNRTFLMYPETRGRTSTESIASACPVNSCHSTSCFCSTRATVTACLGGAAGGAAGLSHPVMTTNTAGASERAAAGRTNFKFIVCGLKVLNLWQGESGTNARGLRLNLSLMNGPCLDGPRLLFRQILKNQLRERRLPGQGLRFVQGQAQRLFMIGNNVTKLPVNGETRVLHLGQDFLAGAGKTIVVEFSGIVHGLLS